MLKNLSTIVVWVSQVKLEGESTCPDYKDFSEAEIAEKQLKGQSNDTKTK